MEFDPPLGLLRIPLAIALIIPVRQDESMPINWHDFPMRPT